jgi:hypothetical protein
MLSTIEQRFEAWSRAQLELHLAVQRCIAYQQQGEGLQDRVNARVASRLAALEAAVRPPG